MWDGGANQVAGSGSVIEIPFQTIPLLPIRGRCVAEILEYEPLSHFLDRQRTGPMRLWRHRHSFRPETRNRVPGTVVHDEVEYELPFGPLGRLVNGILIEQMMHGTFQPQQQEFEWLLRN